jgi:hypothetical protein
MPARPVKTDTHARMENAREAAKISKSYARVGASLPKMTHSSVGLVAIAPETNPVKLARPALHARTENACKVAS